MKRARGSLIGMFVAAVSCGGEATTPPVVAMEG